MGIKVANNAFATLAAGITNSATSITVASGQGARFPSLGVGDYFYATLINTSNQLEIVKCTARSGDVLTVVRAQEATTARAYDVGDRIEIRITAQTFVDATDVSAELALKQDAATAVTRTSATGAALMPVGTTAQRPASPQAGMYRLNSTTGEPEWYDTASGQWIVFRNAPTYQVEYLVVAGGGSGALGGGGAGGYREASVAVMTGASYSILVGAGGAGVADTRNNAGNDGSSSSIGALVSSLGGGGGGAYGDGGVNFRNGRPGGSGGGGGGLFTAQTNTPGGAGTSGQGFAGGRSSSTINGTAGGGGGASAVGVDGTANSAPAGNGGAGASSAITGTAVTRAGGGGAGSSVAGSPGVGGAGGGGGGGASAVGVGGTANTGGGGGGSGGQTSGSGGSGIVIIRYLGAQRGTGGTVTSAGGFTIHTFTTSGTFTA